MSIFFLEKKRELILFITNGVSAVTHKLLKQRTRVDKGCFWPHVQN